MGIQAFFQRRKKKNEKEEIIEDCLEKDKKPCNSIFSLPPPTKQTVIIKDITINLYLINFYRWGFCYAV